MIDWKRKLTSRKFWAAVVGFVTPLIITLGGSESTATQVAGLIMAGATLIAYIIGEGLVDSANATCPVMQDDVIPQTDEDDEFEDAEGLDESESEEANDEVEEG